MTLNRTLLVSTAVLADRPLWGLSRSASLLN